MSNTIQTPWLQKTYSAQLEQSAASLQAAIDGKSISLPNSANWDSTYNDVNGNSAKWNDTYTKVNASADKWTNNYETVNKYSASWAAGGANIPESANWNETYNVVSDTTNGSAAWNGAVSMLTQSADKWGEVYQTVYGNSGSWAGGGLASVKTDGVTVSGTGLDNSPIGLVGPGLDLEQGANIGITKDGNKVTISADINPKIDGQTPGKPYVWVDNQWSAYNGGGGTTVIGAKTDETTLSGNGTTDSPLGIDNNFLPYIVSKYRSSSPTDEGYIGKVTYVFHENYAAAKYNYIEVEDKTTSTPYKMYTLGQPWREMLSATNGLSATTLDGGKTTNGHWEVGVALPENATNDELYGYNKVEGWKVIEQSQSTGDYLPLSGGTVSGKTVFSGSSYDNLKVTRTVGGNTKNAIFGVTNPSNSDGVAFIKSEDNGTQVEVYEKYLRLNISNGGSIYTIPNYSGSYFYDGTNNNSKIPVVQYKKNTTKDVLRAENIIICQPDGTTGDIISQVEAGIVGDEGALFFVLSAAMT